MSTESRAGAAAPGREWRVVSASGECECERSKRRRQTLSPFIILPAFILPLLFAGTAPLAAQELVQPARFALVSDEEETLAPPRTPIARAFDAVYQPPPDEEPLPPIGEGELPLLPDTRVIGRPESFPSSPLTDDVLVSPSRIPILASENASSVTLFDEAAINRTRQIQVTDVLRGTPGVDVVQQGARGGITSLFLRGTNSQHTKVLLDGIPINDPSNAGRSFDFSSLMVDNVERIEVLRGPQSVIYGSDAIGGVVNIVTKRGDGPISSQFGVLGGSYGTSREAFATSGGDDLVYFSLGGSWTNVNGFSTAGRPPANVEADGYQNGTLSGRFGYTPSDLVNIDYVFRWSDVHSEIDDTIFPDPIPVDNLIRKNLSRQFYQRVQLQSLAAEGAIDQRIGFATANYRRTDTDPGAFIPPYFEGTTRLVDYLGSALLYDGNLVALGASYYEEEAFSTFDPEKKQNQKSIYVEDQLLLLERWTATFGARWDDNSRAGPASTYRATSSYTIDETGTRIYGTLGTGFRVPSLAENLFAFGNPDLKPETSKGWDCGVEQQVNEFCSVGATYFRNDLRNLIVFDFGTFTLENVGQARTSGVETFARWELTDNSFVLASYTFCDAIDLDTGDPLVRRPRDKASLNYGWRGMDDRALANLYVVYVGSRSDTGGFTLDPYITVNAAGSYDLSDNWQLVGRIDNLFNAQYEEVTGYATAGLSGYAGLNATY